MTSLAGREGELRPRARQPADRRLPLAVWVAAMSRRLKRLAAPAAEKWDMARLFALALVLPSLGSLAAAMQLAAPPSVAPLAHRTGRLERATLRSLGRHPRNSFAIRTCARVTPRSEGAQ